MRGTYIGEAHLENRGMVRVYQDLDNSQFFFCDSKHRDQTFYVGRSRVKFRKTQEALPKNPAEEQLAWASFEQPTLFDF